MSEYVRYVAYMMERNLDRCPEGVSQQIVLFDLKGFSLMNNNMSMLRELIAINQAHYPERLSLALVINAPPVFTWVWQTLKGWIDVNTAKKVHVMSVGYERFLIEHIDALVLEGKYGGARTREYPIPPEIEEPPRHLATDGAANKEGAGWLSMQPSPSS